MLPFEISSFLQHYLNGTHSLNEHQAFINWLKNAPPDEIENIADRYSLLVESNPNAVQLIQQIQTARISRNIETAIDQLEPGNSFSAGKTGIILKLKRFSKQLVAAALLIITGTVVWIMSSKHPHADVLIRAAKITNNELAPGSNKALLVLGNGSVINLDEKQKGQITKQGNVMVDKPAGGQLRYIATNEKPSEILFNTLKTPRGGQYSLILPDGTKVWLNASSSITYPTSFTGGERKVAVTGEVYFEVAHNTAMPFRAMVNKMEVKVFGTHFNINAYNDEASVKTSLLEGSVSVTQSGKTVQLMPGQQAQVDASGSLTLFDDLDMDEVIAWKNGYFSFNKADLPTVMRQIARWYDVDVKYEGKIPERLFGGKIDRGSNASEVLKILAETKVHFSIEGKTIIVRP